MSKHKKLTHKELKAAHAFRSSRRRTRERVSDGRRMTFDDYCKAYIGLSKDAVERQLLKAGYVAPQTKTRKASMNVREKYYQLHPERRPNAAVETRQFEKSIEEQEGSETRQFPVCSYSSEAEMKETSSGIIDLPEIQEQKNVNTNNVISANCRVSLPEEYIRALEDQEIMDIDTLTSFDRKPLTPEREAEFERLFL